MVGNFLGNVGLFRQGMNQAEIDQERLAQLKQQTAVGAAGLEDVTRTSQEQEAQRSAVQGAEPNMRAMSAARADAAWQAGDSETAQKYMQEAIGMAQKAEDALLELAVRGTDPVSIDANVEKMVGANSLYDKGSLRIEKRNGRIILNATKDGKPLPEVDATAEYAKKQKQVPMKAGATSRGDIYIQEGPQEKVGTVTREGKPTTSISITKTEGGEQAQKELPMFNAISKKIAGHPGMGTFDQFGNETLSPEGNVKAAIGNQIAQTNRNLDPATVVNIVMNGKPKVIPKTGEKAIEYKGKYYRYSEGSIQPQGTLTTKETTRGFAQGGKVNHKGIY